MSDEQRDPWDAINQAVGQHERERWKEVQRWDDPPRVRMRIVVPDPPLPLGMIERSTNMVGGPVCRDIMIGDTGGVVWPNVECDSE